MTIAKLIILDDYQNVGRAVIDWSALNGKVTIESLDNHVEGDALIAALEGCQIVIAMRERTAFTESVLRRLPGLKLLITTGMSNATIDLEAATRLGIAVCGTRGVVGPAAELTWALLLALARNVPQETENLRGNGPWQTTIGTQLQGKTLGIVGLGKLGTAVSGYGNAFGMNVIGWSRSNTPERSAQLGITYAPSLHALLREADVVSLHLRLTADTESIMGRQELGLMKKGALLINTARSQLVDESALIEALKSGGLRGAGLDVYDIEPLPAAHAFRNMGNVLATPHLGYVTEETYRVYFSDALENVTSWLDGKPVRRLNGPAAQNANISNSG